MLDVRYEFVRSSLFNDFKSAFFEVITKIERVHNLVKMNLFFESGSDEEYDSAVNWMNQQFKVIFSHPIPTVSYIAQKPLQGTIAMELLYLEEEVQVEYVNHKDFTYSVATRNNRKALFLSGLRGESSELIGIQANSIFQNIEEILVREEMKTQSIVRQWNYIPEITGFDHEFQRYQQFNDSRTLFYQKADWVKGYPAATGIGTQNGPLVIDLIAIQGHDDEFAIINPRQINAHVYSDQVLIGENDLCLEQKSTPKFERAKLIVDQEAAVVFVSGTAAILGEESLSYDDVAKQTHLTLDHIDYLLTSENLSCCGRFLNARFDMMRVYIKSEDDYEAVQKICEERYPTVPFIYLLSDVCRDELLVEIEAFVRCF